MTAMLRLTLAMAAALGLSACGDRDPILPGERLDPLAVITPGSPMPEGPAGITGTALSLPAPVANGDWTHRGGNAAHAPGHAALRAAPQRIWSQSIGQGDSRRQRITADPVVAGGRIFTMDSGARVAATARSGGTAWTTDITPVQENPTSASGGGLAYEGGRLFATTGFGELVALDAASGAVLWRQRVDTAIGGAPTPQDGVVYVAARNSVGWAVRASDGRVLWQSAGTPSRSGVMGVSAPAVQGDSVVFPFSSGEIVAADRASGLTGWTHQIAGTRPGRAIAFIRDVTGDPVISGGRVFAGTSSGRISAVDLATGLPDWTATEGASSPVTVAGGSVFAVNDQAQLVRLDAATGGVVWRQPLPYYTTDRVRRQDAVHAHYGPVLAGGRLHVASSDGMLRSFDPASGALVGQAQIPGGAASAPVVAGQTLYVVARNGQLHAYQ